MLDESFARHADRPFSVCMDRWLSYGALDRLSGRASTKPHNSNLELLGQGIANFGVGLMSGMPVTGVVVRSSVNVQSGGRTRLAAILHGVVLTLSALYLGRYISKIPLAALAGLQVHVLQRALHGLARVRVGLVEGVGHAAVHQVAGYGHGVGVQRIPVGAQAQVQRAVDDASQ
mgnify:CR=1 FL=1